MSNDLSRGSVVTFDLHGADENHERIDCATNATPKKLLAREDSSRIFTESKKSDYLLFTADRSDTVHSGKIASRLMSKFLEDDAKKRIAKDADAVDLP